MALSSAAECFTLAAGLHSTVVCMSLLSDSQLNQHGYFVPENPVAADQPARSWLSQFGLLRVQGPDSEKLLQGQLTCDVVALDAQHWTLGACCNAKGRMVANFIIARDEQGFWLRLPQDQVAPLQQHLQKYAVFFKAELQDLSTTHAIIADLPAETAASGCIDNQDLPQRRVCQWQDGTARLELGDGRREYWLEKNAAEAQLQNVALCCSDRNNRLDLNQGIIWVTGDSREHWIPQNIDWHRQGGISFSKGCYTGQEIVARLQYLGKAKKALFRISSSDSQAPALLCTVTSESGKNLGEITAWQRDQGLALLNDDDELRQVRVKTAENQQFSASVQKLSYTEEQTTNSGA